MNLAIDDDKVKAIMERGEERAVLLLANRTARLNKFFELGLSGPSLVLQNEFRMVSEAFEAVRRLRLAQ